MRTAPSNPAYALSPLQQGMFSHQAGRHAEGVDVVQIVCTLAEPLGRAAFESAWQWLAARHDILRTAFRWGAPEEPPVQEVAAQVAVEFTWHDWQHLAEAAREDWWAQLLQSDRARGFDLATPPLWRVTVVETEPASHRVLFTFHHLLLDARSLLVLMPELFAATEAAAAGRAPEAPEPVPFREYIEWLAGQDATASADYWRATLAGFRTPTPLPGARARTGVAAPPGPSDRTHRLPLAESAALQDFARAHGVTVNTLVQGAWALLLSRCTGEEDVVFGAVRACRAASVPAAAQIVGPLINTVPVRVAVAPDRPLLPWLRALRQQWLTLRAHEHVPLTRVRGWSDVPAGTPLFETLVSYQEPAWDTALAARGGAWTWRHFTVHNQVNHPLALDAAGGPELQLRISYDATRFSAAAIDRLLGHLGTLLAGMVANPDATLGELPLLTPAENYQLLAGWNGTTAAFPPAQPIPALVAAQAARAPEALAVADRHAQLTYGALTEQAAELAAHLRAHGVGPNVFVGVCLDSSVDLVVALLAVLKAGGAYVPMDPAYPAERLAFMVEDAGMPLLLTQRAHAARFASAPTRVACLEDLASAPAPAAPSAPVAATPDDLAYLIYTSGSTGQPKGVPIRHRHLANLVAWHQLTYAVRPSDRATQLASPAFDACAWELWPYLAAGASVHIPPPEVRVAPARLVQWLANYQVTLCFLPTPLAEAVMDEAWPPQTTLRGVLTGGDRLRRWPGTQLPCPLFNHYGPTENTVVSTAALVPLAADGHVSPAIGRPIANTEAYVLDRQHHLVPIGVPGELHVGGAGLTDGYHRRPELNARKFIPHPFSGRAGDRLYATGDLVRWREDGQLEFLGRVDQQLKIRGHRIEPAEIETLLNRDPRVRESLVLAREDATGQPQLIAYFLRAMDGPEPDPLELTQALHRHLPAYMVPAVFVALDAWPLTPNGKVDRAALPGAPAARAAALAVPPRPGLETTVAQVWAEVLGRPLPGAYDDFFQLGGHSLRAAQVVSRLNATLKTSLSVRHLFEHSTVAGLAAAIEQLTPVPASPVPQLSGQP